MTEPNHTISESADKIVLNTTVKRGTGTRDEDKLKVRVKGEDANEVAAKLKRTIDALEKYGVTQALRETQPGEDDE